MATLVTRINSTALGRGLRWPSVRIRSARSAADRPPMVRGEQILVAENDATGVPVVATTLAIYRRLPADSDQPWQRLGWEETGRLTWDPHRYVLDLAGAVPDRYRLSLTLTRRTRIAALCAERVAASHLAATRIVLPDGAAAIVQARRRPGSSEVCWVVMLENRTDPNDPDVQARVCAAIRTLRIDMCLGA